MNSYFLTENEYPPKYKTYIEILGTVDLVEALETSIKELLSTIENVSEEQLLYRYAEGKWTLKELLQHIIDTERILSYRALRFSRNDATTLQGFDENWYVDFSNGNDRAFTDLLDEFAFVRKSSILLFKSFTPEMLGRCGSANNSDVSVRALGFIIAGHQKHHLNVIKERYLKHF